MNKLSLILFVSIFVLLFTGCSSDSPRDVVEKSLKCRMKNDVKGLANYIYFRDGEDGRQYYIEMAEMRIKRQPTQVESIESFEILDEDIDENKGRAKVTVRMTYSDGTHSKESIRLVREHNRWWIAF